MQDTAPVRVWLGENGCRSYGTSLGRPKDYELVGVVSVLVGECSTRLKSWVSSCDQAASLSWESSVVDVLEASCEADICLCKQPARQCSRARDLRKKGTAM